MAGSSAPAASRPAGRSTLRSTAACAASARTRRRGVGAGPPADGRPWGGRVVPPPIVRRTPLHATEPRHSKQGAATPQQPDNGPGTPPPPSPPPPSLPPIPLRRGPRRTAPPTRPTTFWYRSASTRGSVSLPIPRHLNTGSRNTNKTGLAGRTASFSTAIDLDIPRHRRIFFFPDKCIFLHIFQIIGPFPLIETGQHPYIGCSQPKPRTWTAPCHPSSALSAAQSDVAACPYPHCPSRGSAQFRRAQPRGSPRCQPATAPGEWLAAARASR